MVVLLIVCLPVTAPGAHDDGGGAPGGAGDHLLELMLVKCVNIHLIFFSCSLRPPSECLRKFSAVLCWWVVCLIVGNWSYGHLW